MNKSGVELITEKNNNLNFWQEQIQKERPEPVAFFMLAKAFCEGGYGKDIDMIGGLQIMKKASKMHFSYADTYRADMYFEIGKKLKSDKLDYAFYIETARNIYLNSWERDKNACSLLQLGNTYNVDAYGDGNMELANEYTSMAHKHLEVEGVENDPIGQYYLGDYLSKHIEDGASKRLIEIAKNGDNKQFYDYAKDFVSAHEKEKELNKNSSQQGMEYLTMSAEANYEPACYSLLKHYTHKLKDVTKAKECIDRIKKMDNVSYMDKSTLHCILLKLDRSDIEKIEQIVDNRGGNKLYELIRTDAFKKEIVKIEELDIK